MSRPGDPFAKQKLLAAAERVFAERGVDRAKVEEITRRAGLSKGAFYLHFRSKEEAFNSLVSTALERLAEMVRSVGEACTADDDDARFVAEWFERDLEIFEFIWQNRALMALLLDGGRTTEHRHLAEIIARQAQEDSALHIARGQRAGLFRVDVDPARAAIFIAGGYDRTARLLTVAAVKPDLPALMRELQGYVARMVGTGELIRLTELFHESAETVKTSIKTARAARGAKPRRSA